jgi:hypothetical protein
VLIAKSMLDRIKQTSLYKQNDAATKGNDDSADASESVSFEGTKPSVADVTSPRRKARAAALRDAKNLKSARDRQIVVGRPTWPLDEIGREQGRVEKAG